MDEIIALPPRWRPTTVGDSCVGRVIMRDDRRPSAPLHVLQATDEPVACDIETVSGGGFFVCDALALLDECFGAIVRITATERSAAGWTFDVMPIRN